MALREDLLTPIPGSNPSGPNLRYAPVYDKIKEARREEDNVPQGEWQYERKLADYGSVLKLAGEALAKQSKDLQLAAWITEAALREEGFSGLKEGLDLLRGLIENFWDTLYPEVEDGDAELRAAAVEWVGTRLEQALKSVPLTRNGYDWFQYQHARQIGYEQDANTEAKTTARAEAIADGKLTAEGFDEGFKATPKEFYVERLAFLDGCLQSIEPLDELCQAKFGDVAPTFGPLRKTLEEVRNSVSILLKRKREAEPDQEPEESAATAEQPAEEASAGTTEAAPVPRRPARKAVGAEPSDRADAFERVIAAAGFLRREDPYNPGPYLILRGLRWGELRAAGWNPDPALLEPPLTEIRQQLKSYAMNGEWQQVLELSETAMAMPCGRAWLDLQRYAVRACEELGSSYDAVAAAIRAETRALIADLPSLTQATLLDDTPTANAETQAWLTVLAPAPAETEPASMPVPFQEASEAEPGTIDSFDLAMQAARSGRVEQALEILAREISQERSGRTRFSRKIQLAQICMSTGHEAIAYPILEELAEEIERRKLEEWEAPETIAQPLALLFRCIDKLDRDSEEKKKIYGRLCRLDPVQALACSR